MRVRLFTPSYCCILLANFLLFFGFWLLVPLLPFYLKDTYNLTEGTIGIILACYTLSALIIRPFSGFMLDTFTRKPLYLLAYTLFTSIFLGYIIGGTLLLFIVFRIMHGFAFGTVTVGGNTLVIDIMPSERRGEGLGYYGLTNNTAMSLGPMTGLFLKPYLSYQLLFAVGMFACIIGLVLASCIHAPHKEKKKTPPLSLDRFFLIKGIPASIALLMLSIPYGATTNFVAMYVNELGLNVPAGAFFVLMALGMGISRIFSGKFVDKGYVTECIHYGYYLVIVAFLLLGLCKNIMSYNANIAAMCFFLVPLLQGIGFGIIFPAYNSLYINLGTNNQRATATSTYLTSWDVGIGLGIVLSGIIAESFSFSTVYILGGIISLVSMFYFNGVVTPHYQKNHLR